MLIFTAQGKLEKGSYFPVTAVQRFDAAGQRIENGVYLGLAGSLSFEGRLSWKQKVLAFVFERVRVKVGAAPQGDELGPLQRHEEAAHDGHPRRVFRGELLRGQLSLEPRRRVHGPGDRLPLLRARLRRRAGQGRDARGAREKHGARHLAVLGGNGDPVVHEVGHDPVGPPAAGAGGVEERGERRGEAVERRPVEVELVGRDVAGGLGAVREAGDARERQRDEVDERRQRGTDRQEAGEVARGGDEGHAVAPRGQALGELEAGEQVAHGEPREDDDVQRQGRRGGLQHCRSTYEETEDTRKGFFVLPNRFSHIYLCRECGFNFRKREGPFCKNDRRTTEAPRALLLGRD